VAERQSSGAPGLPLLFREYSKECSWSPPRRGQASQRARVSRENLNCPNAVAVAQTTVQTGQPDRITYLLAQLLGEGVKKT